MRDVNMRMVTRASIPFPFSSREKKLVDSICNYLFHSAAPPNLTEPWLKG